MGFAVNGVDMMWEICDKEAHPGGIVRGYAHHNN